jgi:predicted transcriptional regulator
LDDTEANQFDNVELAAEIVAAYVKNNSVSPSELPKLLTNVYAALNGLATGHSAPVPVAEPAVEKATPAQIRKSIRPDALISFVDGKPYKTLKRHLGTHGLDPHSYRQRYGLPSDYPTVAPSYAAQRSALAKGFGLGRSGSRKA